MAEERHTYIIKAGNGAGLKGSREYKFRSTTVSINVNKTGLCISYSRPKLTKNLFSDDLFRDALKKVELMSLLKYNKRPDYNNLSIMIDGSETYQKGGEKNETLLYSMVSDKLRSPMASGWCGEKTLSTILNTAKSNYDRRFAAMFSLIMSKSKAYEYERFMYLWMSMNSLYGFMSQQYSEVLRREWRQLKLISAFLGVSYDSRDKKGKDEPIGVNALRGKAEEIIASLNTVQYEETVKSIMNNQWDEILQPFKEQIDEAFGSTEMDPKGFFVFWLPYQLRCKYFHGEKAVPMMSFSRETPIPTLCLVNNILEQFLDSELVKWFDNDLLETTFIPRIKATVVPKR